MIVNFHTVNLRKKFPLQISRGVHDKSQNLFVEILKEFRKFLENVQNILVYLHKNFQTSLDFLDFFEILRIF